VDLGGEAAVKIEAGGGILDVAGGLAQRLAALPDLELGD